MMRAEEKTRMVCLLLSLALAVGTGCLIEGGSGSDDPDDPLIGDDGGSGGGDGELPPTPVERALFILSATDIRTEGWQTRYAGYDVFVVSAGMSASDVALVRDEFPDCRLLAYTNAQDVPIGLHSSNSYYQALEAAFDSSLCIRDLDTDKVVRIYGAVPGVPGAGTPAYVMDRDSADALVAFLRDVTMPTGWDGLYVDQCTQTWANWRLDALTELTGNFDINHDGMGDRLPSVRTQYETWRPYFTERLREELGSDVVIIGNSGGALADPSLNGITLEGVGSRFTVEEAELALSGARAATGHPFLAVLWATTVESETPSLELAGSLDGVHYGELDELE